MFGLKVHNRFVCISTWFRCCSHHSAFENPLPLTHFKNNNTQTHNSIMCTFAQAFNLWAYLGVLTPASKASHFASDLSSVHLDCFTAFCSTSSSFHCFFACIALNQYLFTELTYAGFSTALAIIFACLALNQYLFTASTYAGFSFIFCSLELQGMCFISAHALSDTINFHEFHELCSNLVHTAVFFPCWIP